MWNIFSVFFLATLFLAAPGAKPYQQDLPEGAEIVSPLLGEPVQGLVPITGVIRARGFLSASLSFGYTGAPVETWFPIAEGLSPTLGGLLAEWDTSLLTDGNYTLRLLVTREDGTAETILVEGVRVRNYTAVETPTPTPLPSRTPAPTGDPLRFTATAPPTETGTPAPFPTVTPFPRNPAQLSAGAITNTLIRGAAGALAAFLILGLYTTIRNSVRK